MKALVLGFFFCFTTTALSQPDPTVLLKRLGNEGDLVDLYSGDHELRGRSTQPYFRVLQGFETSLADRGTAVQAVRYHYSVLVGDWMQWTRDPDYPTPLYHAARSRVHLTLIPEQDGTVFRLTEETQVQPAEGDSWRPPDNPLSVGSRLQEVAAFAFLVVRYSANPETASAVYLNPPQTLPKPRQAPPPTDHPLVPGADGKLSVPELKFSVELGALKHLYWTGSIDPADYVRVEAVLNERVPR